MLPGPGPPGPLRSSTSIRPGPFQIVSCALRSDRPTHRRASLRASVSSDRRAQRWVSAAQLVTSASSRKLGKERLRHLGCEFLEYAYRTWDVPVAAMGHREIEAAEAPRRHDLNEPPVAKQLG